MILLFSAAFYFLGPEAVLYHLLAAILALGKQYFHDEARVSFGARRCGLGFRVRVRG